MIHLERKLLIEASPETVWNTLGRYMHIDEFAPFVTAVEALTDGEEGVGSRRRNIFENGSSVVEEVTEWQPGTGYTVKLSEMDAMPIVEASSTISITPEGDHSSLKWTFDYQMKYGPLGWLLGQTLMKMMMGKAIAGNLEGLAAKVCAR